MLKQLCINNIVIKYWFSQVRDQYIVCLGDYFLTAINYYESIELEIATVERKKVKKPKRYLEKRILKRGFPKNQGKRR